jgi:hypothetical protein
MASHRTRRTAAATLLLVVLATIAIATAGPTTPGSQQANYCKQVEVYRLTICATAILPATPLGRQLRWALAQLAGDAASLTEAEVRSHFSAEFFAVWGDERSPAATVAVFRQTIAEFGTFRFVGFAHPPRAGQAVALVQSSSGVRGALEIGVTNDRPARIEFLDLQEAGPTIVPKGDHSGWFEAGHSNSGLFSVLYASTHPRQVAGLVLIDAVHPATIKRRLAMLKPLVSQQEWEALRQLMITVPPRLVDPEGIDIWTSERQTRVALRRSPLRPMPLVVLAHGHPDDPPPPYVEHEERLWQQLQRELAQLVPEGRLVVATQSGHDIQLEQPELVLDAIHDVRAVRAGDLISPWTTLDWI